MDTIKTTFDTTELPLRGFEKARLEIKEFRKKRRIKRELDNFRLYICDKILRSRMRYGE